MEEISELEKLVIHWSSIPIAVLIFGSLIFPVRVPVEAAILTGYEKIKGKKENIKDLYEGNVYKILSHGS